MFAENYRSLRSIRMDLAGVNLFIGENGVGKSNLYRALQLVQAAVRGHLAREIAEEGGMASAIWSGPQRVGKPARIRLDAELIDEERAITFRYRIDTVDLDRAVADAFAGARLQVPEPGQFAEFSLVFPDFPHRAFSPRELSDGQMRFLALAAALLSYRRPRFIALNEPETSLHPDMLPALAAMVASAAGESQIWIVTHSERLAELVRQQCGVRPRRVIRKDGATWIDGMRLTGAVEEEDE